ncbi:MAG: hypothetical protein Q9182_001555 [Xanthomendoza sp. 2 TL-2023]
MAPAPTKRITRSTIAKKSKVTGKSTKSNAAAQLYPENPGSQDYSESFKAPKKERKMLASKAQVSSARKRQDSLVDVARGGSNPESGEHIVVKKQATTPRKKAVGLEMDGLLSKTQSTRLKPRFKALSPWKGDEWKIEAARMDTLLSHIPSINTKLKPESSRPKKNSDPVLSAKKVSLEPHIPTGRPDSQHSERHPDYRANDKPKTMQKLVNQLQHYLGSYPDIYSDQKRVKEVLSASQPQTIAEYKTYYQDLRSAAWDWAQGSFHDRFNSSPSLDLMKLATTSPELMEYINSTTSSPQLTDWESLLAKRRAEVVYAILGKALHVHIFGEEMFGATLGQREILRASDRSKMDHDGFIRQRQRAHQIKVLLGSSSGSHLPPDFFSAIHTLQGSLVTLLTPLLPLPLSISVSPLANPLLILLLTAANLALAIRQNPDMILYFPSAPSPSTHFDEEEMSMSNKIAIEIATAVKGVVPLMRQGRIQRVACITGWPACVAYRPVVAPSPTTGNSQNGNDGGDHIHERPKRGIYTNILARADVFVTLESIDRLNRNSKERNARRTLRGELWHRVRRAERAEVRRQKKVQRRIDIAGAAAMVAVVGGYAVDKAGGREFLRESWETVKGFWGRLADLHSDYGVGGGAVG